MKRFTPLLLALPIMGCGLTDVQFPVAFKWEGVAESASGTLTTPVTGGSGGISATLGADVGTCSGRWVNEGGRPNTVPGSWGTWQLRCNRGLTATGTYRMTSQRVGEGKGRDTRGRLVSFKIGETATYVAARKPGEGARTYRSPTPAKTYRSPTPAKTYRSPTPSSSSPYIRESHCNLGTTPQLEWEEKEKYRKSVNEAKRLGLGPDCRVQLGLYYVRPSQPDQASNTESAKKETRSAPQEASLGVPKQQIEKPDKPPTPRPAVVASPTVRKAQGLLSALGYNLGSADGISGPRTRAAVEDYQLRQGLPVTGEVTEDIVARLESSVRANKAEAIARARERQEREEAARSPKQTVPDLEYVSSGTGFVINSSGHAVTNAHVVDSCGLLTATLPDRTRVKVIVVGYDQRNDLAAVKLSTSPARWAKFRSGAPMRAGDEAVAFGFPLPGRLASGGNVTTGIVSALAGLYDDTRYYQITVPVQPGNSGGPLLDTSGNVIGVITGKLNALQEVLDTGDIPQNVNFALKAALAQTFLNSNGIAYETGEGEDGLSAADVGERAKNFSVRLDCFE